MPPLGSEWKLNVLRQEVEDSVKLLDERRGILHVRRHLAASPLFKGVFPTSGYTHCHATCRNERKNYIASLTK